jgi:hypothetical protein
LSIRLYKVIITIDELIVNKNRDDINKVDTSEQMTNNTFEGVRRIQRSFAL